MALACSFGEIDGNTDIDPAPSNTQAVDGAGADNTPGNSVTPSSTSSGSTVKTPTGGVDPAAEPYDPDKDPFTSELGKEVKAILEQNCGQCHTGATGSGGMNYILDLKELVKNDKVIPGIKEDSQLFVRMQQGSMPPAFIRTQRPTFGQIDQVGQFIDELPKDLFGTPATCDTLPFLSNDDQISLMASDIQKLDAQDQPFTRYLTITYSSNAGGCEGERKELERQRFALFKGINSVSTNPVVGIPKPIDEGNTIYRIDIRDYNWDRQIDLLDNGTVLFNDGWDAIVDGVGAFAVPYTGDQADDLVQDSGTAIPFLPVNAFIQATEFGDLYYSLIGAKANLFDFELQVLKIDTKAEIADDNLLRGGFSNSGVSKQERVLNRFDQNTAGGYAYWVSFDFDGGSGTVNGNLVRDLANESIYQNPIDFKFTGGEAIFNLPNGMQGYYVANAAGARLNEAPVGIVIDPAQNNGTVTNGASCHSCHNAGMITFTDTVRQFVLENRTIFDNATYEHVLNQYPTPEVFQAAMDADSALHVNAVVKSGIPKGTPDAVSRTYLDFQLGNVDARIAAGELQVTKDVLLENLELLDPRLTNLDREGGYVDRDIFTDAFVDALCTLHSVDENQPANCP
jgi:mono/diheme cytochrome c family protein